MALKLRTALMASMGAIVLGSAATGWVSWYTRDMLAGHLLTTQTTILPNTVDMREANRAGIQLQAAARGIVLLPEDTQAKENLSRTLEEFPRLLEGVIAKARRKEVREDLQGMVSDWKSRVVPAVQRLQAAVDAAREAVSSMSHAIEEQAKAAQLLAQQVEQAAQAADGAAERAGDSEAKAKLLLEVARQAEEGLQHSFRA